jgi:hypothetical protein
MGQGACHNQLLVFGLFAERFARVADKILSPCSSRCRKLAVRCPQLSFGLVNQLVGTDGPKLPCVIMNKPRQPERARENTQDTEDAAGDD